MHNQISRKRQDEPCLELGDGRWRVYPISVAGVNADTLKYENWTEYSVFEHLTDEFGTKYWSLCGMPEWATHAIAQLVDSRDLVAK